MNYYEVYLATNRYNRETRLTYSSEEKLEKRQVIEVKLRQTSCLAAIYQEVTKPKFSVNNIDRKIDGLMLTTEQLALFEWMETYYPGESGAIMKLFLPSYLSKYTYESKEKTVGSNKINQINPELNPEQLDIYNKIGQGSGTFLLNGVTGSGKTRIYAELARNKFNHGKSVLVLTPEIALTAPLEQYFKSIFKNSVLINHSNLTPKQKLELHKRVYKGKKPLVIIGPRSSLFLPFHNLGLIVVDEFHETSYKQESSPRYLANRVSSKLSQITQSSLLFGSATPSVSEYYLAEQKKGTILNIHTSALTNKRPEAEEIIVDLSDRNEQSSYPLLSRTSLIEISNALDRNEQVLVYLNKRGTFRSVLCKQCGWQLKCLNCDLPLVYHQDSGFAVCHTCGYKSNVPKSCPDCGSIDIFFTSPGTKAITEALAKAFPSAQVKRYDKDNSKADRLENNFDALSEGKVDIIVGTQMISKGFDLPNLSIVVMLITENVLNFPDYTSNERSYQLIKQLAGRVNRGHKKGKVILQTFTPKSEIIGYNKKDWIDFYKEELSRRKILGFPPFWSALKIQSASTNRSGAEKSLDKTAAILSKDYKNIKILGPSPSFVEKRLNKFYWQLIVMAKDRKVLAEIARTLPNNLKKDLDPVNFL